MRFSKNLNHETKKYFAFMALVLDSKIFDFNNLIYKSDLLVKPEDLPCGELNVDFYVYKHCFTDDAFEILIFLTNFFKSSVFFLNPWSVF